MATHWATAPLGRWRNGYDNSTSRKRGARRGRALGARCVWRRLAVGQRTGDQPMSVETKQNLQDTFLNSVRRAKTPLTIFLVNGVKLQGVVSWFDNFCVLLRRDGQSQLVYKHAISTIMPAQPVQLYEPGEDESD